MKRIYIEIETEELCSYGCGNKARFKNGSGKLMCDIRSQLCPSVKEKNKKGLIAAWSSGKKVSVYDKLPKETKDKMSWNRGLVVDPEFKLNGKGNHKKFLILERGHKCESCNLSDWLDDQIPLELEHKDGNNRNNVKENLLLLCPNCHAKTKFYRGRNINSGKIKVSDKLLLSEIEKGLNTRQVLINVGLTPKGGNYERVNKLRGDSPIGRRQVT